MQSDDGDDEPEPRESSEPPMVEGRPFEPAKTLPSAGKNGIIAQ
jgi:hypothetical protein